MVTIRRSIFGWRWEQSGAAFKARWPLANQPLVNPSWLVGFDYEDDDEDDRGEDRGGFSLKAIVHKAIEGITACC
jgi:hypothetical protein